MEPQEIDSHLLNNSLRQLIFFTGLNTNDAQHLAIFNAFVKRPDQRAAAIVTYKMLVSVEELYDNRKGMPNIVQSAGRASSPPFLSEVSCNSSSSMRNGAIAMVKRRWPLKYLQERPALIVTFVDLDWDHPAWLEMRTECESKINALRQRIGQRETKLALVLIQRPKATSMDDPIVNEKALELCQHCRLNSRLLFVFPRLSDERALIERVTRLEKAFHDIAQEFYHACFKRIRSRSVPNNDAHLLVRQQYKLAFVSELREDRHSALRYYKQAYQICHELDVSDFDVYEHCSVVSLLNFKICELNFVLNSAVEAINQFRRHHNFFFKRESAFYPSRELAAIELSWWKAQQCRLFAELFSRAVSNGLAAYPSQNPGRFLGEAATHYKKANSLIRTLKSKLSGALQQRQTSPLSGDPLQSFDLSTTTVYYGQRPWRVLSTHLSDSQSVTPKLPPLSSVNQQLLEHSAKLFLENNVHENYVQSLQLLSAAVAQFKRYGCERFANLSLFDMAEECIASQQFQRALQILNRLCVESKSLLFCPFLCDALVALANAAFCSLNINEWTLALLQLLHPRLANATINLRTISFDEHSQGIWMDNLRHFLLGDLNFLPFPLISSTNDHPPIFSLEQLNSFHHQWHQLFAQSASSPQFQLDMTNLLYSPIQFSAHFLVIDSLVKHQTKIHNDDELAFSEEQINDGFQIATADNPLLIEIALYNISSVPLRFERCSLVLDEILHSTGAKKSKTLSDWLTEGNSSKNAPLELLPGRPCHVFFVYKTALASSLQQLMQLPTSSALVNRCQSPLTDVQNAKELLVGIRHFSLRSPSGSISWDIDHRSAKNNSHQQRTTENRRMETFHEQMGIYDYAVKVRPHRCNVLLSCPFLADRSELELFVDECVQLSFILQNAEANGTLLKNIWVICHKICREDEELASNHPQHQHQSHSKSATIIRRTFAVPKSKHLSLSDDKDGKTTTLLVPMFSQELASVLAPEQSTDFSVLLQSKSNNCISLQIRICCTLPLNSENESQPLEEPAELVQCFPIRCLDPFESDITVFCENGEKAQCLVFGQRFRVQLQLKCNGRVTVHNVHWKLNDAFELSDSQPLSSLIEEHFGKLKISSVDTTDLLNTHSIWMKVANCDGHPPMREPGQRNGGEDEHQTQLGDVVVEWSSTLSSENVRSLLALPTMPPILAIPITLNVELANNKNVNDNDKIDGIITAIGCAFRILQPFRLRYCLRNTSGGPLAVHLNFEQPEGISMDGIGEDNFLLLPNGGRVIEQYVVPTALGFVNFPKPTVRCVSSNDYADLEFGSEDLEQLNHLITRHTFNSLPEHLFILP